MALLCLRGNTMRTFSIVTAVVTALIILIVGYGALTTNVGVQVLSVTSEPASNQYEAFSMATAWARENDSMSVIKFTNDEPGELFDGIPDGRGQQLELPARRMGTDTRKPGKRRPASDTPGFGLGARAGQDRVPGGAADERAKPHCGAPGRG